MLTNTRNNVKSRRNQNIKEAKYIYFVKSKQIVKEKCKFLK